MNEIQIHFDNAIEARELTGGAVSIDAMERHLHVSATARDTWLKITGDKDAVASAGRFMSILRQARSDGVHLTARMFEYALEAFVQGNENSLEHLYSFKINVGRGKTPVFPRTLGQRLYLEAIKTRDVCFGVGPAGTGKTYLAMAMAVQALINQDVSRIILTRPAIEAGEALGFLPGDMHAKIMPYLRPLYDALYDMLTPEEIDKYMEKNMIEVAPLAYMRGRTLNHAFIILDEAQNTTPEQMFMFLTRQGFDSKSVITGDLTQVDLPNKNRSGLVEAAHILRHVEDIGFAELQQKDVVRHPLVQKIIQAYTTSRSRKPPESEKKDGSV